MRAATALRTALTPDLTNMVMSDSSKAERGGVEVGLLAVVRSKDGLLSEWMKSLKLESVECPIYSVLAGPCCFLHGSGRHYIHSPHRSEGINCYKKNYYYDVMASPLSRLHNNGYVVLSHHTTTISCTIMTSVEKQL